MGKPPQLLLRGGQLGVPGTTPPSPRHQDESQHGAEETQGRRATTRPRRARRSLRPNRWGSSLRQVRARAWMPGSRTRSGSPAPPTGWPSASGSRATPYARGGRECSIRSVPVARPTRPRRRRSGPRRATQGPRPLRRVRFVPCARGPVVAPPRGRSRRHRPVRPNTRGSVSHLTPASHCGQVDAAGLDRNGLATRRDGGRVHGQPVEPPQPLVSASPPPSESGLAARVLRARREARASTEVPRRTAMPRILRRQHPAPCPGDREPRCRGDGVDARPGRLRRRRRGRHRGESGRGPGLGQGEGRHRRQG